MTNNKNSNEMKKKSFRDNIIIVFFQTKLTFKSPRQQIFQNYYLGTFHLFLNFF